MSELAQQQAEFAQDIRSGGNASCSDAPGMKVYRELFFNNVCGFIDGTFPVCKDVVGEDVWRDYSRRFFSQHACETPLFLRIPEEYLHWLVGQEDILEEFPFLAELAHYEWLELAVDVMPVDDQQREQATEGAPEKSAEASTEDDVLDRVPVLNAALMTAAYHYPVHQIQPGYIPDETGLFGFILFRDADDTVRFVQCSPLSLVIVDAIRENPSMTGREVIHAVLAQAGLEGEAAVQGGLDVLSDWRRQGILI